MEVVCVACGAKGEQFRPVGKGDMERHVAIVHGRGAFSTLRCGKCQRKYYDFADFEEHTKWPPMCNSNELIMHREPLSTEVKEAFDNLVTQSMQAVDRDVGMHKTPIVLLSRVKLEPPNINSTPIATQKTTPVVIDISDNDDDQNNHTEPMLLPSPAATNSMSASPRSSSLSGDRNPHTNGLTLRGVSMPSVSKSSQARGKSSSRSIKRKRSPITGRFIAQLNAAQRKQSLITVPTHTPRTMASDSMVSFCRTILVKRHVNGHITCKICKSTFKVLDINKTFRCEYALDHATKHLGISIFRCKLCDYKAICKDFVKKHVNLSHNLVATDSYHNDSAKHKEAVKGIILECFDHCDTSGKPQKTPVKNVRPIAKHQICYKENNNRSEIGEESTPSRSGIKREQQNGVDGSSEDLISYGKSTPGTKSFMTKLWEIRHDAAIQMIKRFANRKTRRIECLICHKFIVVMSQLNNRHLYVAAAVSHAKIHSAKEIYSCKVCGCTINDRKHLSTHIWRNHNIRPADQIIDKSDQFHDEIMVYLKQCFDHGNVVNNGNLNAAPMRHVSATVFARPVHGVKVKSVNSVSKPCRLGPKSNPIPEVCEHCGWKTRFVQLMQTHIRLGTCRTARSQLLGNIKTEPE